MGIQSLGQEDPLEEEMATLFRIFAWKIPSTEEPGGLQSLGSQRVGHNWRDLACTRCSEGSSFPRVTTDWSGTETRRVLSSSARSPWLFCLLDSYSVHMDNGHPCFIPFHLSIDRKSSLNVLRTVHSLSLWEWAWLSGTVLLQGRGHPDVIYKLLSSFFQSETWVWRSRELYCQLIYLLRLEAI